MKKLRLYENFQIEQEIADICKKYNIKNWSINSEGSINVDDNVDFYNKGLSKLPLKFGRISGHFICSNSKLLSLEGSPVEVGGDFYCNNNELTSLEGSPKHVGGDFICTNNKLVSLEGSPKEVGCTFNCNTNKLISLEGSPKEVGGDFYCNNNKLTSLEGGPKHVGDHFNCSNNKLISFEGAPDFVVGDFYCPYNPISSIWKLFEDYSKIELFNYYDIVRELKGKPALVLSRLNQFLEDIGKPPVEKVDGYINI